MNDKLLGSDFVVERFKEDGKVEKTRVVDNCYLVGETEEAGFITAITDCDGLVSTLEFY